MSKTESNDGQSAEETSGEERDIERPDDAPDGYHLAINRGDEENDEESDD
jgi:hypothetical protein